MTARSAGTRPATLQIFNRMYEETKKSKSFENLDSALNEYVQILDKKIADSYEEENIKASNPVAGAAKEVGLKQTRDILKRFQSYRGAQLIAAACTKMVNHLSNPKDEDLLKELYESWPTVISPPIPDNPYELTYFTRAEYRETFWDNFTVFAVAADFTNQIGYAWKTGTVAVAGFSTQGAGGLPWLAGALGATTPSLAQRTEAVSWIINFMYFERAMLSITWYDEQGDGVTDVPDAVANRTEYKRLLEKEASGEKLSLEEALELQKLKAAAEAGDFTNVEEFTEDPSKMLRFTEQTVLMRNLKSFALNYSALQKIRQKKYEKTYLMYGKPSEMVNKLTLKPGMSTFLNFRTHEISQLAPKFKLFQITYNKNNEFTGEVEYKFANKNNITGGDLTQASILESRGREAVGVKSFEWKYIGSNPVTARNDLSAQLVIYFQSFDDLFQERPYLDKSGNPKTYRYVDLILRNPIAEGDDASKSCAVSTDSRPETERQKVEKYETKIIVGWNFKGTELKQKVTSENPHISDLSYFNEVLFMTLIDHEFGIEEDGTFNLTITYRARLDALLQDKRSDILATTNVITKRAQLEDQIKKVEKKCEQSDDAREQLKKLKDDYEERKKKFRQESYQSIIDELSGKTGEAQSYPRLYHIGIDLAKFVSMGSRFSSDDSYLYEGDTKNITVGVGDEQVKQKLANKISDPKQVVAKSLTPEEILANQAKNTQDNLDSLTTATEGTGVLPILATNPIALQGAALYGIASNMDQAYSDYQTNSMIAAFEQTGEIPEDINKFLRTTVDIKDGVYNIHYFFLGDLIELLAQRSLNSERQKLISGSDATLPTVENIKVLLGTMEWFPRAEGAKQEPFRVNLAALPISLMVFNNFMMRRVLAKKRDVYSLLDFMRDFIRYLIDEVMGGDSEESDSALKLNVEVKSTVLTMPGFPEGVNALATKDPILAKIEENQGKKIKMSPEAQTAGTVSGLTLDLDLINEKNTIVPYTNPESNSANRAFHYLTIYVENKSPTHLRGIEDFDKNAGIYHFHIGSNRSIFKRASFKRTDATYLRESRFVNESYNPLATLASVYDVDMEMFGNTVFYPGQYLFINPFGLGKSIGLPWDCNSYSNIMGIGGYHLVTEVSSIMDEDGFSTNVKARWETSGDGRSKNGDSRTDSQTPNCQTPEATEIK